MNLRILRELRWEPEGFEDALCGNSVLSPHFLESGRLPYTRDYIACFPGSRALRRGLSKSIYVS